jgi:hypothetical protein
MTEKEIGLAIYLFSLLAIYAIVPLGLPKLLNWWKKAHRRQPHTS